MPPTSPSPQRCFTENSVENLGEKLNRFDQDDNSDLEDGDNSDTSSEDQPTVFKFLYEKMREDIKGT